MKNSQHVIAIVTALKLERDAVIPYLAELVEEVVDGRTIHQGFLGSHAVVVECFHGKGNVKAAARTTLVIERWKPSIVFLVGIAGGTKKPASELLTAQDHHLGDVLVAEQIIDYESGKQTEKGMEHRPQVFRSSPRWVAAAHNLRPEGWVHTIRTPRPDGTTGRVIPQIHFGTIASGEKVIKDRTPLDAVSVLFTNLVGVEMEGFGAATAAFDRIPPVEFLLLKAICDWAALDKKDAWQQYAADAAAACLVGIIQNIESPAPAAQRTVSASPPQSPLPPKLVFTQRLADSWEELADALQIPPYDKARFDKGNEPRQIWEWLESRNRLDSLGLALQAIGRGDLVEDIRSFP